MFLKSLLLLFVLSEIDGFQSIGDTRACPYPRFDHGRFRIRQKSKLIKFMCLPGYSLVGNKYATCRDGEWDVPLPVCVKPGCKIPTIENGIPMVTNGGAWVVVFCISHFKLNGSPAIYCDGKKWNTTVPTCVASTDVSRLSCDFEQADLCGWTQDLIHDFDWKRLNKKTPSSFLFTGPSYDHTFGKNGNGYYMYIESTSRLENDTARLISPMYEASLTKNGCFSFYYHMFGKTTGGLRIYQKPEKVHMENLLLMTDSGKQKYLLFEKWGNLGDVWYTGVAMLNEMDDDFQIIIEGIRGSSFTSDIAIDDVAILEGYSCTAIMNAATTPAFVMPDSCVGRCDVFGSQQKVEMGCGCTANCVVDGSCCPDFFEICVFETTSSSSDDGADDLPQTQKLIASTTASTTTEIQPSKPSTSKLTTRTTKITIPTTVPTTKSQTTLTPKTSLTTRKIPTTKQSVRPTLVFKTSTTLKRLEPTRVTKPDVIPTTRKQQPTSTQLPPSTKSAKQIKADEKSKAYKEQIIEIKKVQSQLTNEKSESSSLKVPFIVTACIFFSMGAVLLVLWARGERGRSAIAKLRGRVRNDPDVQYLHSAGDDD